MVAVSGPECVRGNVRVAIRSNPAGWDITVGIASSSVHENDMSPLITMSPKSATSGLITAAGLNAAYLAYCGHILLIQAVYRTIPLAAFTSSAKSVTFVEAVDVK